MRCGPLLGPKRLGWSEGRVSALAAAACAAADTGGSRACVVVWSSAYVTAMPRAHRLAPDFGLSPCQDMSGVAGATERHWGCVRGT